MADRARPWPVLTVARIAPRDERRCIHCGATVGLSIQHRLSKGMGGSLAAERPSNGIILCMRLNVAAEASQEAAELCLAMGWKLRAGDDPSRVAVFDWNTGYWYQLSDDPPTSPAARTRLT